MSGYSAEARLRKPPAESVVPISSWLPRGCSQMEARVCRERKQVAKSQDLRMLRPTEHAATFTRSAWISRRKCEAKGSSHAMLFVGCSSEYSDHETKLSLRTQMPWECLIEAWLVCTRAQGQAEAQVPITIDKDLQT